MNPLSEASVSELLAGLPDLARLSTLGARLQTAAIMLHEFGFDGVQIVVIGRRIARLSVRRGTLPFFFEPELVSRGRRTLHEFFIRHEQPDRLLLLAPGDLGQLHEFGRPPERPPGGLQLIPLMLDGRLLGCISLDSQHVPNAEQRRLLQTWCDVFVAFISNDIRLAYHEELEGLMRSLRSEHELANVLTTIVETLANEYGVACEAWRRERSSWLQLAVYPLSRRIPKVDLAVLVTGEEGVVALGNAVGVPLVIEERLWGALVVDERFLESEYWDFLRAVARHCELALENALAFERHRIFALESAALSDAGRTLLGYTRVEPLAAAISRLAIELGEAEHAALYLEHESDHFTCAGNFPRNAYRPFEVADDELRAALDGDASLIERADGLLLLPLGDRGIAEERGGLRGVLAIDGPADRAAITQETVRLLEAFATLGTLALRNARLFEDSTEANRALGESNAFKDDLLAMFTHDFKGPLTVISGYGELVLEKLVGEERDSVSIILSQVRRLATLADDALALAKAQSTGFALERMPGELVAFVRELIIVSFGPQSERIVLQPRIDDVWLNFDPHALRHVLENVIGNALKYSDDEVSVEVLRERNEVAVIVRDHGIGIPADELVHVFGRFARASNARRRGISGSGVGLYIANRIVEEHGGAIFVSSSEGEGSTFEVRLPLAP